ncbi:putative LOC107375240-like protein [Nothobranchius furzeri]|uniref:LOC107375240-like protein n=5 Tax=Nothobranchius TaxID=28779 RepID=A0A1A7ZLX6_NOTFU|nr:putative LOC107375240-like protein [Nothobranchius furzeri]
MKLAILCLCLAGTACALPYQYMPHYTGFRQQEPPTQVKTPFTAGFPQPALPGAYSVEFIYPHRIVGGATGTNQAQTFPSYGFIKYSIPQPPGRQSVEVFYPYDFTQQKILPHMPPFSNSPMGQDIPQFGFPPLSNPQQPMNMPSVDANAHPSQNPLQPLLQDQPTQTSQAPAKA